jgi:hypothetical protein
LRCVETMLRLKSGCCPEPRLARDADTLSTIDFLAQKAGMDSPGPLRDPDGLGDGLDRGVTVGCGDRRGLGECAPVRPAAGVGEFEAAGVGEFEAAGLVPPAGAFPPPCDPVPRPDRVPAEDVVCTGVIFSASDSPHAAIAKTVRPTMSTTKRRRQYVPAGSAGNCSVLSPMRLSMQEKRPRAWPPRRAAETASNLAEGLRRTCPHCGGGAVEECS